MNDVKLCIHRAADTIGGNCIEIMAPSGERILLDAGRPLDTPDDVPTPMPPSLDTDTPVLGVLLSHAHQDHCGLLGVLPVGWPVFCGAATEELLLLSAAMQRESVRQKCTHWKSDASFPIGPFSITPRLIDHSAFDAYAIQIDVAGKTIVYSGDFRAHGRKAARTKALIQNPPSNVDALIMEGTNLPSGGVSIKPTPTEAELEEEFATLFRKCKGRVFVSWSSTNIDRTVTLFRACKKSGRVLVPDLYCMMVLMRLKTFANIPQPEWGGVHMRAVITNRMVRLTKRLGKAGLVDYLKSCNAAMGAASLEKTPENWVIMARSSLVDDYARKGVIPAENDLWLWSLWEGYLGQESSQKMKDFFAPCQTKHLHGSGHASPDVLQKFAEAMKPRMLIPVHGEHWQSHDGSFSNTAHISNGQWISIS